MSKVYMDAEYIPADIESLVDANGFSKIEYKKDIFVNGFNDGTYYAGFATALFNAGLDEEKVASAILTLLERGK